MRKDEDRRLDVMLIKCIRNMCGGTRIVIVRNEVVRSRLGVAETII